VAIEEYRRVDQAACQREKESYLDLEDGVFAVKRCRLSGPEPKRSAAASDDET